VLGALENPRIISLEKAKKKYFWPFLGTNKAEDCRQQDQNQTERIQLRIRLSNRV
jgi:hypothetical protein